MAPIDHRDEIEELTYATTFVAMQGGKGKINSMMALHANSIPRFAADRLEEGFGEFVHDYGFIPNGPEGFCGAATRWAVCPVSTPMRH